MQKVGNTRMAEQADKRLFVALPVQVPAELGAVLSGLGGIGAPVKPVAAEQMHLTLRFLGLVPGAGVGALAEAIGDAVREAGVGAFEMRFTGLGRFPENARRPARVVYAHIAEPAPAERLAEAVSDALLEVDLSIEPEQRAFQAHLTLARIKHQHRRRRRRGEAGSDAEQQLQALLDKYAQHDLGRTRAHAVQLIASRLTPAGPVYTVQQQWDLGESNS